jgi:secondary thiamine-phosphate synthase enzyme
MITTNTISLKTNGNCDILDITPSVEKYLSNSGIKTGSVTVFITGSTAGITTIEYEPGLIADFKAAWERIVPKNLPYHHDRDSAEGNGFSHVRASLLGASLVVPIANGKLALGTWQQIVVVDFDNRSRARQVVVQVIGE